MLHEDRRRAESFGTDAEQYHRVRPRYPAALVDALVTPSTNDVLDVGCGTGIAGQLFRARGCRVLGVEPDARMAEVARDGGLEVEVSTFEPWDPAGRRFDLLISAQAWHWVDPDRGAAKAAEVVREGGRVGIFWNMGRPSDALRATLSEVYARHEPELEHYSVLLGNSDERLDRTETALVASGRFAPPTRSSWRWVRPYSTSEWLENLVTHSDHRTLPADRQAPLLDDLRQRIDALGGTVEMTYEACLLTAERR